MKKKKIFFSLSLFFGLLLFTTSCSKNYLEVDKYFDNMLTKTQVFKSKTYTEQWLWNVYSYLGKNEMGIKITALSFPFASDEAIFSDRNGGLLCQQYQNGEFGPSNQLSEDVWGYFYEGIRQASIFIGNVDNCKELTDATRVDYAAQARFLRAYYYWMLLKQYGPVPILGQKEFDISLSYQQLEVERNTYDECVQFITEELLQCSRVLPSTRQPNTLGQPTQGAAMALKAKILLYAASPQFNGNTDYATFLNSAGKPLISQVYSEEKWAKAAAAAKEVIKLGIYELNIVKLDSLNPNILPLAANVPTAKYPAGAGGINPLESYKQTFSGKEQAYTNRELIFVRPWSCIADLLKHNAPKSLNGWNSNAMTLKQLDAYYMFDGKDISDATAQKPYNGTRFTSANDEVPFLKSNVSYIYAYREPRFYASAAFNGSVWDNLSTSRPELRNKQIFYYKGELDGKNQADIEHYVLTGVAPIKFLDPTDSFNEGGQIKNKVEPDIRYADVLLWYAEALNNLTKSYTFKAYDNISDVTVSRDVNEMHYGVSRVRFRAGLPDLTSDVYGDPRAFYVALKRERQVELFFEGARYFDLRRWKDADVEENMPLLRYNTDATMANRADFYTRGVLWVKKQFLKKMYLWPLPTNDLTRNSKLVQNPGW